MEFVMKRVTDTPQFIRVDDWVMNPEDMIIKQCKGSIIMPISQMFGLDNPTFDRFDLTKKRGYNSDKIREHYVQYINYFEKFYDPDKELLSIYAKLKYLIDLEDSYNIQAFIYDINKYILKNMSLMYKINCMNNDNYMIELDYNNKKNPNLQYNNYHGVMMMKMGVIVNILIPLITHFIYAKKIQIPTQKFILDIYQEVLNIFDVDIYNKLYETCLSNISRHKSDNPIWNNQDIRRINVTTHTLSAVNNIIVNIIPKYVYNENLVMLNFISIANSTKYQITDIGYEYDYMPLSSSKRDEDQNSEFDKFEASLNKIDEALYLQNVVNAEQTMQYLCSSFKVTQEEVDFYMKELSENNSNIINSFQKDLIFNLFYKYFGDTLSIRAINSEDYIKLMIIAKRMLLSNNLVILPYILSGRLLRLVSRKNLNKKELLKLQASPYYSVINNYNSEKIEKYILSIIGTILSSEFQIIDFQDENIHGQLISTSLTEIVCEEILIYINLI